MFIQKIDDYFHADPDFSIIRSVVKTNNTLGDVFPVIRFWLNNDPSFIPSASNRNECIPIIGVSGQHDPIDYRFYILDFPGKSNNFEYICHSNIITPDHEDTEYIQTKGLAPKHLTWKFFEKHVIGRYLGWIQGINIFT